METACRMGGFSFAVSWKKDAFYSIFSDFPTLLLLPNLMSDRALQLIEENKRTKTAFLDLGNCRLTKLPAELLECEWLEELNLGDWYWNSNQNKWFQTENSDLRNKIKYFSNDALRFLKKLKRLYLRSNQIVDINFLANLTELQALDLSYNWITDISSLTNLKRLQFLDISCNQISDYNALKGLAELKKLNLRFNQVSDISFLLSLTRLEYLDLSSDRISDYDILANLTELQTLNLRHNGIGNIDFLANLIRLETLYLRSNRFNNYNVLENLANLKTLDLSSNGINNIDFLANLKKLQALYLRSNGILNISILSSLTNLQILDLSSNRISDYSVLANLNELKSLNLSSNRISDIGFLANLTDLQNLYLSSNHANDIRSLTNLTRLKTLDLSYNQLSEFTSNMLKAWPDMHILLLYNNPIVTIPKEIFYETYQNVLPALSDYFASLEKGRVENEEVKLIIIGNTAAGKTSLTRFLQEGEYETTQSSTHGISLKRWLASNGELALNVNVWDFGGQEYYHATHRLFLDDHAVYLIVWETETNRQGVQENEIYLAGIPYLLPLEYFPYSYWLDNVRYYAPESTVLMVQTKIDKNLPESVEQRYFEKPYSVRPPIYQVSVQKAYEHKANLNHKSWLVFKSFEAELLEVLQNDAAKYPIGTNWIKVRDAIRQKPPGEYWVFYKDFEDFCRYIDPTIEMKGLMIYLGGSASTIIHYENNSKLKNIVFLNPQWVSSMIYEILSYDIQEKHKGEFSRSHVENVLSQNNMKFMTDTFIELMKAERFELIFEKPNVPDTYIVPQYLPDSYDEKAIRLIKPISAIGFTLHFPRFMPKSVFMQFMVRYGNLAEDVYWKYGIALLKNGYRIVAECLFSERQIRITIEDKPETRQVARELFGVLWQLSDYKSELEISINGTDFFEIGELQESLNQVSKLKSKQNNWLNISNFSYLFGVYQEKPEDHFGEKPKEKITNEPKMKTIKIFLASSSELEEDREQFEIFINRENKLLIKEGVFLELNIWEDFIDAMSQTRLQDEYNKVIRECDIFVSLFFTKVGKYTAEEFTVALKQFKETDKPLVYTYFKNAPINMSDVKEADVKSKFAFEKKLKGLGHFPTSYTDIENLKYQFKMQLDKILPTLR
ncbi:leucine-rich repeat domain-containing protein [Larkinella sp. VNQ87]|uniref:leucine-rich repeat domain-containing protein n=1 Tax=Larkinella sp. VNQ87 TaxID=3400921 RepID=UPI003C00750C